MNLTKTIRAAAALSVVALLWGVRPPLEELAALTSPSPRQLANYVYIAVWLGLLLICLVHARALLRPLKRARSVSNDDWLPSKRRRTGAAPLAMPLTLPRVTLPSPIRDESSFPRRPQPDESQTEERSAKRPEGSAGAAVLLLGPVTITGAQAHRHGLRAAAIELVAYLALHPHGAARDELLEALWPNQDPKKTRGRLYQATRDARRLLGENAITRTKEHYLLDRTLVTTDIDQLEAELATAERSNPEDQIGVLEHALALFRGEPLAGSDYSWAEPHIRQLRSKLADLLAKAARARLDAGNSVGALEAAERGLKIDQFNEELWRLALESEGAAGLRTAVEERYRQLQHALDRQFGLKPSKETRSLYRQLLGQT